MGRGSAKAKVLWGIAAAFVLVTGTGGWMWRHRASGRAPVGEVGAGYADPASCASCHAEIAKTYVQTGMGGSFHSMTAQGDGEDFSGKNVVRQETSARTYTMLARGGKFYESRLSQSLGDATQAYEKSIDYVIGSGNHARTYLHRTSEGKLLELPVSWYSETGGHWDMSPGYDHAGQKDFRRAIGQDCMFCHNGYPELTEGVPGGGAEGHGGGTDPEQAVFATKLPEGIDCQRCHGPGQAHVTAAKKAGVSMEAVRAAILNPAKLTRERQMNVCMQCHLETTSLRLPNSIRRYERTIDSFRPGEALENYAVYFDHKPGTNFDDRLEVAHQAYRLAKSQCFLKSEMTCTTCHNPHMALRGEVAQAHYMAVCNGCHTGMLHVAVAARPVTAQTDCLSCHMWKRRTDDVVHVVMTDHYIQRIKPKRDFLAPLKEVVPVYHGEVVAYLPKAPSGRDELYLATAQVSNESDLERGIPRLRKDVEEMKPTEGRFYFDLASAYAKTGNNTEAVRWFGEALTRDPDSRASWREMAGALAKSDDLSKAAEVGEKATAMEPVDTAALTNLGNVYLQLGRVQEAQRVLQRALAVDADLPDAENLLGLTWLRLKDVGAAEKAFRAALLIEPDMPEALNNLGDLLAQRGDLKDAAVYLQRAIAVDGGYADGHRSYALLLAMTQQFAKAAAEMKAAVGLEPKSAELHVQYGDVLVAAGQIPAAQQEYMAALKLDASRGDAHLGLGTILAAKGQATAAHEEFVRAAASNDPVVKQAAVEAMR